MMSSARFVFYRWGQRPKVAAAVLLFTLCSCVSAAGQNPRNLEREKPPASAGKRVALVIGNGSYRNAAALPNPSNDATDMVATLKDLGFEVISGTDQTKQQMEALIRQFGTRLAETKATGLFFYAGHGIAKAGTNYLVPIDADIQAEDEVEYGSVSVNFVLGKMAAAENGFNIVILDACRNNPFARKWRNYRDIGNGGGLARMDAPTGTLIAYATKPGDVASDGTGRNGLYTGALLKQMRVKNVDVTKMFQRVRADVLSRSGGKQVPFDESSIVGDFYFAGRDASAANAGGDSLKAGETAFWQTIENSNDPKDFENYLARTDRGDFGGVYKDAAELKLQRLKNPVTIPAPTVTVREIETAFKSNLVDDVIQKSQRLLQSNPNSPEANAYLGLSLLNKRDADNSAIYIQKAIALGQLITLPFKRLKVTLGSHYFEEAMIAISASEITVSAVGSIFKAPLSSVSNSTIYNYKNQCGVAWIEGQFTETSKNSKKVKQEAKKFNMFPPNSVLTQVQPQGGVAHNEAVCDQQTVHTTVIIKLLAGLRVSG